MLIGQEKLLLQINNYTLKTFPHSCMLIGDRGCGKHTLVNMLSDKFNIEVGSIDFSEYDIDSLRQVIEECYLRVNPYFYIVNGDNLSIQKQNALLKFIEEPLSNAFIFILTSDEYSLLDTIRNRCQVFKFELYNLQTLETFGTISDIKRPYIKTPGDVIEYNKIPDSEFKTKFELAAKVFDHIGLANIPNVLTICDKLCVEKDKKKLIDNTWVEIFVKMLKNVLLDRIVSNRDDMDTIAYQYTTELLTKFRDTRLNRENLFKKYLLDIKSLYANSRI